MASALFRPDIIFTRPYLNSREMYGPLAIAGAAEVSPGLCLLAAVVRKSGYNVQIIDTVAERLDNESLAREILRRRPRFLGISSVTLSIYKAAELAALIRRQDKDIKIIVGGAHVTGTPRETMERFSDLDVAVIGEGDATIVELLNILDAGGDLSQTKGILYREDGQIRSTSPREFIKDLDTLPFPAWDLLPDIGRYYSPPAWSLKAGAAALIVLTRGCSNKCIYCDRSAFGESIRGYSARYAFEMIKELHYKFGIRQLRINDDNFMLFKKRLLELCELIISENLKFRWSCFARADSVSRELLDTMRRSGCWQISYGVETGSQELHDLEKKRLTLEVIERAVRLSNEAGIKTVAFTMICHPKETKETIFSTIKFCNRVPFDDFKMMILTPFPGTELYSTAGRYGLFDRDWRKMNAYTEPCFIPSGLTKEKVIKYRRKAYLKFYLRPKIIFGHIKVLSSVRQLVPLIGGFLALLRLWMRGR